MAGEIAGGRSRGAEPAAPGTGHPESALPRRVERAFTFAILLSALRCTVQYVVLPFVLPWVGVAARVPPWVTLALGTLALISLARNMRYLWHLRHARRRSYLLLALVVIAALLLFMAVDLRALLRW